MDAGDNSFYRAMPVEICQGDIFDEIPHLFLRQPPVRVLRQEAAAGGRMDNRMYEWMQGRPGDRPPANGFRFSSGNGETVLAACQITFGILLTYDCEIDKDQRHRAVAMVRTIASIAEADRPGVRGNQSLRFFHLPPVGEMPESYVDFRRVSTIGPELLLPEQRIASLATTSVIALRSQYVAFLTRERPRDPAANP